MSSTMFAVFWRISWLISNLLMCFQCLTVTTPLGEIKGRVVQYNGGDVIQFLGVPYAQPPIHELMLEKPQPMLPWHGVLNATQYGPTCVQTIPWFQNATDFPFNLNQSPDCLLLNIYVPKQIKEDADTPVMLYIHGGFYKYGTGNSWDGSLLALSGNVIVVTINYRLDVFGFLSTEDKVIPGNYGLWDQRLAIKWVKENIEAFGGDGDAITLFGQSAGSYSIGMHLVSPTNRGLFQRAISQSGVALSPVGLTYDAKSYARSVSDALNCTYLRRSGKWNTRAFLACIKTKSEQDILSASAKADNLGFLAFRRMIGPVVDGDFLRRTPRRSVARDDVPFKHVDMMTGTTSGEGGLLVVPLIPYQSRFNFSLVRGIPENIFKNKIVDAIVRDYFENDVGVNEEILDFYSARNMSDADQARQAVNMYGDFILQAPTVETLECHSQLATEATTYQYYFTHVPERRRFFPWFQGANHADELQFVFGATLRYPLATMSERELMFSHTLRRYWTNFAKYGNPNGRGDQVWPEFNTDTRYYMQLSIPPTVHSNLLPDRVDFWLNK